MYHNSKPGTASMDGPATQVEGIGKRSAQRLAKAGVKTCRELLTADLTEVQGRTKIPRKNLWKWQSAVVLFQIPQMNPQIAEALVHAGINDVMKVAQTETMELYHAVEQARTPREARNIIPDRYGRVITPRTMYDYRVAAYRMCFPGSTLEPSFGAPFHALSAMPFTEWCPAAERNYGPYSGFRDIDYIVIHAMYGRLRYTMYEWMRPMTSPRSAHYLVGQDGKVVQMVPDNDVAFHAANPSGMGCTGASSSSYSGTRSDGSHWTASPCNSHSLGIELEDRLYDHGGYPSDPQWATSTLYETAAQLVRSLCERYSIPKCRVQGFMEPGGILGHADISGRTSGHDDPGPYFNWDKFIQLVDPQDVQLEDTSDDGGKGGK